MATTVPAPSYTHPFGDAVDIGPHGVSVRRAAVLTSDRMDRLVRDAVFGAATAKAQARWLIWEMGQTVGARPASIHAFYVARGQGAVHGFTVPAINVRGMAYDTARAIFRVAERLEVGALIFEIAR